MPGHKGKGSLGCEAFDITEIKGADVLYSPKGIIEESENFASELFGTAHTFYSAEGSTLAIKAMLALVATRAAKGEHKPLVLAARNVHKAFVYAAGLLDLDVEFIYPKAGGHLCACNISAEDVEEGILALSRRPCAVYITTPDYLGNLLDVKAISSVCKKYGIPLLVDNAHGAYLKFIKPDIHPITLGADMCCDSAHKTLPALTGGAYLHISKSADPSFLESAREKLSIFASTSPSYLILASLDLCNKKLAEGYGEEIAKAAVDVMRVKNKLSSAHIPVENSEPMKIVVKASDMGFTGEELSEYLRENRIEAEFYDRDYLVLMCSAENEDGDFERLISALSAIRKREPIEKSEAAYMNEKPQRTMTIREALFAECEAVAVEEAVGRICASVSVSCPPAVPINICGEVITDASVALYKKHGIDRVCVVK